MRSTRRNLLIGGAAAATAGSSIFGMLYRRNSQMHEDRLLEGEKNALLRLPTGFSYRILERSGNEMTDGYRMPRLPDGMGCFPHSEDAWVLMRNHEIEGGKPVSKNLAYDSSYGGGVSRLVISRRTGRRLSSNMILTGTVRNCAGGVTHLGWLSCEETDIRNHGYVFLCDPTSAELRAPVRLPSFGRFIHEAAAYDFMTGITYMTEDSQDGVIYRHVPKNRLHPFDGGELQGASVVGSPNMRLSTDLKIGDTCEIVWETVSDPTGNSLPTKEQAHRKGAALLSRGEGIWLMGNRVYIASTNGGPTEGGQIFQLELESKIADDSIDKLQLIAQADENLDFAKPDNITVAPWGDLYIAEDGAAPNGIWMLDRMGRLQKFAENLINGGKSEIAGICFSPDGQWLFFNIQREGLTIGVTGPFSI